MAAWRIKSVSSTGSTTGEVDVVTLLHKLPEGWEIPDGFAIQGSTQITAKPGHIIPDPHRFLEGIEEIEAGAESGVIPVSVMRQHPAGIQLRCLP